MLAFTDGIDGYYQFEDNAPQSWYAGLTPCPLQIVAADPNAPILAIIDAMEHEAMMPRGTREFMLFTMEEKAIAMGAAMTPPLDVATSLAAAYSGNILYRKVKDLDNAISSLRAQLV